MSSARAAVFAAAMLAACGQLFDDPVQCRADTDCAHFGAVCDVTSSVCVAAPLTRSNAASPPAPTASPPPPVDASPGDPCSAPSKPIVPLAVGTNQITASTTLGCETDWSMDARVLVRAGATLTIAPGTTLRGKTAAAGLVIQAGATLVAEGTRDKPIVFTSAAVTPAASDWSGLVILGRAPPSVQTPIGGDPQLAYGGDLPADGSGKLAFVRIEYARAGLTLAGVGTTTDIDSVEVLRSGADCFHVSGGTVGLKHLVCQRPGDEQFQFDGGFSGRAQFLFGQKSAGGKVAANGVLLDAAHPVIFNATLVGDAPVPRGYGLVSRNGATVDLWNSIVTGWTTGLDTMGAQMNPGAVEHSIFFGDTLDPAYIEDSASTDPASPTFDDDGGFDEIAWFADPQKSNAIADPGLVARFDGASPRAWPKAALTVGAATPPSTGFFDVSASYIGAFRDSADPWMTGAWVRFEGP